MVQFKRGSLVDSITLTEYVFQYEPRVREKNTTQYAKQNVIGKRLPLYTWVGGGESDVHLDVYLLGVDSVLDQVQNFKNFLLAQADTAAPHPVFINVGEMYVGKTYVMTACDPEVVTFEMAASMRPAEIKLRMRFEETPSDTDNIGVGAN